MPKREELRIAVGRGLLIEDALWMRDVLTSAIRHDGPARVMAPLLLAGHASRIVYEGREFLTSRNPEVAIPALVKHLPSAEHPSIARARHATKMLDNQTRTDKQLSEFEAEIGQAWKSQRALLFETVRRGFTWLQPDLGFYTLDGYVVGATIPLHMRFGLDTVPRIEHPEFFRQFGNDLATSLHVYTCMSSSTDAMITTLDLRSVDAVEDNDHFVSHYLKRGFDRSLNLEKKLLLLLIESEVNTANTLVPLVTGNHQTAAFRARLISLWHALSSLTKILDAQSETRSAARDHVSSLVHSAEAERLSARGMQMVRNRSVHYEIRGKVDITFSDKPMFGIIESLTAETFESIDVVIRELSSKLSTALRQWREA